MLQRISTHPSSRVVYWLDIGNDRDSGQFVLGQPLNAVNGRQADRLRTVAELYPSILDASQDRPEEPSCSAVEALDRQHAFVNSTLANHALALLSRLFREGIRYHGGFASFATGRVASLPINPEAWTQIAHRQRRGGHVRRVHHAPAPVLMPAASSPLLRGAWGPSHPVKVGRG